MIKSIIIDDESKSCETLEGLLSRYCPEIEVIAIAKGYTEGISAINKHKPELIFLDIQMPEGSGFKLLQNVDINFEIIFTTAYDQFAIKAIRYSALDYLLKPIIPDELRTAVLKLVNKRNMPSGGAQLNSLLDNVFSSGGKMQKIVLNTADKMHIVEVNNIIRCESDNYYTNFYFLDKTRLMISKTLKEVEQLLSGHGFLRPHKSHLVNIAHIKSFSRQDGGFIILNEGTNVPVSRRKKESVIALINSIGRK